MMMKTPDNQEMRYWNRMPHFLILRRPQYAGFIHCQKLMYNLLAKTRSDQNGRAGIKL